MQHKINTAVSTGTRWGAHTFVCAHTEDSALFPQGSSVTARGVKGSGTGVDEMVAAENLIKSEQQSQACREHWEMSPGGSNPSASRKLCASVPAIKHCLFLSNRGSHKIFVSLWQDHVMEEAVLREGLATVCVFPILNPISNTRFLFFILGPVAGLAEFALPTGMVVVVLLLLLLVVHLNISLLIFSTRSERVSSLQDS